MANKTLLKYQVLEEAGAIFASAITTDYIELGKTKKINFIVTTGIGSAADVTVKVKAKLGTDGSAVAIGFKEKIGQVTYNNVEATGKTFSIGGEADECGFLVVEVDADTLKGNYDRVALDITAASGSTVPGSIVAVTFDPRYSD